MNLEHQRAGGIQDEKIAQPGARWNGFSHTVGRKDHRLGGIWDFVDFLHKNGTFGPQAVDNESVMNDFVAHVDGGAELQKGKLHDLDGSVHARTKSARGGQQDLETWSCCVLEGRIDGFYVWRFRHHETRVLELADARCR
jgi:hypothetical protein